MKAPKFHSLVKNNARLLDASGFVYRNRRCINEDIEVKLYLDKWGWSQLTGWEFRYEIIDHTRFTHDDPNDVARIYLGMGDILKKGIVSKSVYRKHLLRHPRKAIILMTDIFFRNQQWVVFYDENDLQDILEITLGPVLNYSLEWAKQSRIDDPSPLTYSQQNKGKDSFEDLVMQVDEIAKNTGGGEIESVTGPLKGLKIRRGKVVISLTTNNPHNINDYISKHYKVKVE